MPARIQRRRARGWRAPAGAVYVGRPTRWGNPFPTYSSTEQERRTATGLFINLLGTRHDAPHPEHLAAYPSDDEIRRDLAGRDLMCWCPLDQPCHADVLLRYANATEERP
ncbi:DUF4326 domain-containing protein [Streptomyces sp. CC228A]|uniref:DUF4326 domain-containing protein n=1 Tax=Streptomyces sp. CC228A TaxID=2898186 RepID=UPI001F243E3C|nr:DUF4326 domain-containing protein [Streptomyces sp. CC228A]